MIQAKIRTAVMDRTLILGLLLATLVAASLLLVANPARADTTFTVTETGDFLDRNLGDGACDFSSAAGNQCSLRAAIQEANHPNNPGPDTIEFEIGGSGAGGVKTLRPVIELPEITETVTLDGYSQPGSSPNTLGQGTNAVLNVELDGSGAGQFATGLRIAADNVVVRGLVINRFGADGIIVRDDANDPDKPTGVRVEGNFLGTDAAGGADLGNGSEGVQFSEGKNNTVGGTAPAARNLISGNEDAGVSFISGPSANRVVGNLIGTGKTGNSDLGNGDDGVEILASANNAVGGAAAGAANTIAFNDATGVQVGNGETESDFTGNRVLGNSIFANGLIGIDLLVGTEVDGPTPNDPKDADTGANDLQNKPVLPSATTAGGKTTISGNLNSTPNATFRVQFFSRSDEGRTFLGEKGVTTNANGNISFAFQPAQAVAAGQLVTATATDAAGRNTSEFSAPRRVAAQ